MSMELKEESFGLGLLTVPSDLLVPAQRGTKLTSCFTEDSFSHRHATVARAFFSTGFTFGGTRHRTV